MGAARRAAALVGGTEVGGPDVGGGSIASTQTHPALSYALTGKDQEANRAAGNRNVS